jgi:hypothetical protein
VTRNPFARAVRHLRPQTVLDKRAGESKRLVLAEAKLELLDTLAEIDNSLLGSGCSHDEE